jgi:excinuclease UvrABC nuclease subunit
MPVWTKQFDACLEVNPPVSDEQLAQIPAKRGIVLLEGQSNVPIVMITAASMRNRTKTRLAEPQEEKSQDKIATPKRKSPDLREITHAIYYKRCGSVFETDRSFLELAHRIWKDRYEKLVSWKPPWFVHINISDAYPHFSRTRDAFASDKDDGQYLGPFLSGREAEQFIGAIQDSFDLCRSITCLRNAPAGKKCAYAEMGRCVSPSDGTISMDAYRDILAKALDFAAGNHALLHESLKAQMQVASSAQEFERAGAIKHRLERLEFFEGEKFRHVAPKDEFRFVLVQKGLTHRECKVFFINRGIITDVATPGYPTDIRQLGVVIGKMAKMAEIVPSGGPLENLQMGLIARLLFSDTSNGGLIIRWTPQLGPQELADLIEDAKDDLSLRAPVVRKSKGDSTPDDTKIVSENMNTKKQDNGGKTP